MQKRYFYRRKLPHWQPPEGTFFITYRLFGSIPGPVIERLKSVYQTALREIDLCHPLPSGEEWDILPPEERKLLEVFVRKKKMVAWKKYFKGIDDFLDSDLNGPYWLKREDIAELVAGSIKHGSDRHFTLWAYTIMSNHVHILLSLQPGAPVLWKLLQNSKKYSGFHANKLLGRNGKFWDRESFDHLVREGLTDPAGSFYRILWYILNNPVKAGYVKNWQDWSWTYCHPDLEIIP